MAKAPLPKVNEGATRKESFSFEAEFELPKGVRLSDFEKQLFVRRMHSYLQWELNEWLRFKTGHNDWFGIPTVKMEQQKEIEHGEKIN